jgi:hypothetical protein
MVIWWSNRPPHGFQWDRFGSFIMSDPDLDEKQLEALEGCSFIKAK